MAEHVIITGVRRARELVPIQELKQEAGRIGRTQDGRSYCADIILTYDDMIVEDWFQNEKAMPVESRLSDIGELVMFLMPRLVSIGRFTILDVRNLYFKTLACYQSKDVDFDKVISYMLENEAIVDVTGPGETQRWIPYSIGVISSQLFLPVKDLKMLRDNFKILVDNGDFGNDACLAWALGNLDSIRINGDYGEEHREEISNFKSSLPLDYSCESGTVLTSSLWWCILGNGVAGKNMATNVRKLRKEWNRLKIAVAFLTEIDEEELSRLDLRICRGLKKELVPFFDKAPFPMSKARAMSLLEMGYQSWEGTENVEIDE